MKIPQFNRKYPSGAAKERKEEKIISKAACMLLITQQKWHFLSIMSTNFF